MIHAAAVSDYRVAGIFAERDGKDVSAGKVKSSHPELWLKLVPTPKLVDQVRSQWGFAGVLVKFKLEVGLSEDELRRVAEPARLHSRRPDGCQHAGGDERVGTPGRRGGLRESAAR